MDNEGHQPSIREKLLKLKNGFSVPVKKSDTFTLETKSKSVNKTDQQSTVSSTENNQHLQHKELLKEKNTELAVTDLQNNACQQKHNDKPKKRKHKELLKEKNTELALTEPQNDAWEQKHNEKLKNEKSKKKKKGDVKTDKENHAKKGMKEEEMELISLAESSQCTDEDVERDTDSKMVKKTQSLDKDKDCGKHDNIEQCSEEKDYIETDEYQEETGTWVQCSNKMCHKWRYVADIEDPILVPEKWNCTMNSDHEHNSCDIPEVDYHEKDHIYTKYTIGSIVLAKIDGYPWWPAMVECDPDTDEYYEVLSQSRMVPLQYHVTFFDENVTRSWVRARWLAPYNADDTPKTRVRVGCVSSIQFIPEILLYLVYHVPQTSVGFSEHKREIEAAVKNANSALKLSLEQRVQEFGFLKRYSSSKSKRKFKNSKKLRKIDDSITDVISKVRSPLDDILADSFEDCNYRPMKTASRKKPFNLDRKEHSDKENVDTSEEIKSKSSKMKTAKTDTSKECETSLTDILSDKKKCTDENNAKHDDDGVGKDSSIKNSVEIAKKKAHKKELKKQKQKSHNTDEYNRDGGVKKVKDSHSEIKYNNENKSLSHDTLILDVDRIKDKHAHDDDDDEFKMINVLKLSGESQDVVSSKQEVVSKQRNYIDTINDVASLKVKSGKHKHKIQEDCKEFSEIDKKNKSDKLRKSKMKSVSKIVDEYKENEKKQNVCDTGKADTVELSNEDAGDKSRSSRRFSEQACESGDEITPQTDLEHATKITPRKSKSGYGVEMEKSCISLKKVNGNLDLCTSKDGHTVDKESAGNDNSSKLEMEEILDVNIECEAGDVDTWDDTNVESSKRCVEKSSEEDDDEVSSKRVKQKHTTGRKEKDRRLKLEKGCNKITDGLKKRKNLSMTKTESKKSKKTKVESKAEFDNKISKISRRMDSTQCLEEDITESSKTINRNDIEADQQIVPDIEAETFDDCKSCSDLEFSEPVEKNTAKKLTNEEEKKLDWDSDSIMSNVDSSKKMLISGGKDFHDNSQDFILQLDADETSIPKTNNEPSMYDQFGENFFREFESDSN